MNQFLIQPDLYRTGAAEDVFSVLDELWPLAPDPTRDVYVVSGFGTHNGGVRFFERFRSLVDAGGTVRAVFGGSRSSNQTSRQLVDALLDCGVQVWVINRRYMLHSKLYGTRQGDEDRLVVTSGNFTAPGLWRNIESAISLDGPTTASLGFDWPDAFDALLTGTPDVHDLTAAPAEHPCWSLLYDETSPRQRGSASGEGSAVPTLESMVVTLSHADTARILAAPGTDASKGSQYFWLSKDAFDFFPPLTIRNERGRKATYSCLIDVEFAALGRTEEVRVTFEAENNLDFRLGTGPLRATGLARPGDLAVLTRLGERSYRLRLLSPGDPGFTTLTGFAVNLIGAQGKKYGYVANSIVDAAL